MKVSDIVLASRNRLDLIEFAEQNGASPQFVSWVLGGNGIHQRDDHSNENNCLLEFAILMDKGPHGKNNRSTVRR